MSAISPEPRSLRANPEGRTLKPVTKEPTVAKLVRLTESQLKRIERAAKTRSPRPSSSWYIVQAALDRAEADLAKSA